MIAMKTGVYGGTFNPIHLGHVHILREFIRRLSLQRVLLVPTRIPPHKAADSLAVPEDRAAMCALAARQVAEAPVEVSSIELKRKGKSYTAETLEELHKLYPEDGLYLLMGEDMFLTVDQWYRSETIFTLASLCASPRSGDGLSKLRLKARELEKEYGARCFVEDIPYVSVSSTQVRRLAQNGESLRGLTLPEVEKYIYSHGLYRGNGGKEEGEKP